jgi:RNA polymerase sigma-70 factor, ECF subfamily
MAAEPGTLEPATGPSVEAPSDASLVREVIEGSADALAVLYDRHGSTVFAAAMRTSRDRWIAAEVVQDTFLALWNRAELYDPARGELATWLLTIARNRAIDRLRAAALRGRVVTFSSFARTDVEDHATVEWLMTSGDLVAAAGPEPAPEIALSGKETRASIADAIASLDPMERSAIELAYNGGLSQSEIADRLGWPIGTVKTRTRRALRHLRDALERAEAGVWASGATTDRIAETANHTPRAASSTGRGRIGDWGSAVGPVGLVPTATQCSC